MKGIASKLQTRITHANRNEINIYNLLYNIQTSLYNIPSSIEATANFDFQPWDYAAMDSVDLGAWGCETGAASDFRRCVERSLQLNDAVSFKNLQLSWILHLLQWWRTFKDFPLFSFQNLQTEIQQPTQLMNSQRIISKINGNCSIDAKSILEFLSKIEREERISVLDFLLWWKVIMQLWLESKFC